MNRDIVSEKTSCYIHRYVHKKMCGHYLKDIGKFFYDFRAYNVHEDSSIIYIDRWNQWSSFALDILSDIIYDNTYVKAHNTFPTSREDDRVIEACKYMNTEVFESVINGKLPFVYKIEITDSELVTRYPFMFERMTSAEVEKFFRFGEIAFKTNYTIVNNGEQFRYKMKNFESVFSLEVQSLSGGNGQRIRNRKYIFRFDSPVGFFFVHNIKALNIHWIKKDLYLTSHPASNFIYKRFFKCKSARERKTNKSVTFKDMCRYLNFNYDSNNSAAKKKFDEIFEDLSKLIPIQNHRGRTEVGSITYHF